MRLYYVWITDHGADDGRRAWIIKAHNETEACLAAPIAEDEHVSEVCADLLFKKRGQRIERIQG